MALSCHHFNVADGGAGFAQLSPHKAAFDQDAFLTAVQGGDRSQALGLLQAAFEAGSHFNDILPGLTKAVMAPATAFGMAPLYLQEMRQVIAHLGEDVAPVVSMALTRYLTDEAAADPVPEFADYAHAFDRPEGAFPCDEIS